MRIIIYTGKAEWKDHGGGGHRPEAFGMQKKDTDHEYGQAHSLGDAFDKK